ncbi:MAG: hypothetical protein ACRDL4_06310 [Thermoleophilaceae bacterium]
MADEPYPLNLPIQQIGPDEQIEAFRAVHVASVDDSELELSFRSHYELGLKPQPAERQHAAIYMALSLWLDPEIIEGLARRFPVIGSHIARVQLAYGAGLDRLDPSAERNPQHLTIWGTRESFPPMVADIYPVPQ